jgi:microcystin-dependent protein
MATITTIAAGDQITNSRSTINTNFANLNSDKIETSVLDTSTDMDGASASDAKIPSQLAVKTYVDTVAATTYLVPTGAIIPYGGSSAPTNWLLCDGTAVSRSTYATLFGVIGTAYGAGNGSTTFNLPDFRGRTTVGAGTGTVTASGVDADVSTGDDTLTVTSNNTKWVTGMSVVFTLSSGTITGLTSSSTYYVIRNSATTIKLASTLANAQNGTAIDLTAKSSPVWTITGTLTARTVGEIGGEEAHAMSLTELLAHTHTAIDNGASSGPGGSTSNYASTSGSKGGNAAMNIMQPFAGVHFIIKT